MFDGLWVKQGTDSRFQVEGNEITFLETGKVFEFHRSGLNCVVVTKSSKLEGTFVEADDDGNPERLQWKNGSAWVRADINDM
jgi:hypothetical protein